MADLLTDTAGEQLNALALLKEALALEVAADPDFVLDLAEGQTSLLEIMDAMVIADLMDGELILGAAKAMETIKNRQRRIEERRERRRAIIERAMIMLERDRIERPSGTLTMQRRPRELVIVSEDEIPSAYFKEKTTVSLDKKALKAALKEGVEIPGAHLDNGAASLTIRRA